MRHEHLSIDAHLQPDEDEGLCAEIGGGELGGHCGKVLPRRVGVNAGRAIGWFDSSYVPDSRAAIGANASACS